MPGLNLKRDVRPVTEFRSRTSALLRQLRRTRRPLLLTVNGRSSAILLDVEEYERLTYERDLFRAMARGDREIDQGRGIEHGAAMRHLLARYPAR
jgi:prevent-host-death family protein